jgi:hypothetical protein
VEDVFEQYEMNIQEIIAFHFEKEEEERMEKEKERSNQLEWGAPIVK